MWVRKRSRLVLNSIIAAPLLRNSTAQVSYSVINRWSSITTPRERKLLGISKRIHQPHNYQLCGRSEWVRERNYDWISLKKKQGHVISSQFDLEIDKRNESRSLLKRSKNNLKHRNPSETTIVAF